MKELKTLRGLALLPLYDWPELHHLTDGVWACIREAARDQGLDLPTDLDHRAQRASAWMADEVVFSQLCGSPWYRKHRHHARYLATSDFELNDNEPGQYYSKIVVAADAPYQSIDQLGKARFAYNDDDSQSGVHCLRPLMDMEAHIAQGVECGGHRLSMEAVAAGQADFAAIDAFSFKLAESIAPEVTGALRVIGQTPHRPAPVLITSTAFDDDIAQRLQRAVLMGLSNLPETVSGPYSFRGAVDLGISPYEVFKL